ncbi:unnamed protein product [Polarella glacialis]|uniref:Uncharacterized protein n=1 Tax=Polarella glacialis TaxID=89957 RepID=A0A813G8M6_POLGL|nr:unnamed protein product [Polarella glacialis]CAE8630491.1 unnamed protein product [Polarella glacialis]
MASEQLLQAKAVVREFVQDMRTGKKMMVMVPTGQLKATVCSLSKRLDVFRITRAGKVRLIPLISIQGMHAGTEPEGLRTPLDDLCATMQVAPEGRFITFRFEHINARDTFVMCMLLFAQSVGAEMGAGGDCEEGDCAEGDFQEGEEKEESGGEAQEEGGAEFESGVVSGV